MGKPASQTAAIDTSEEVSMAADEMTETITGNQKTEKTTKTTEKQNESQKFSKYQLMMAPDFSGHKDVLSALMGEDEKYTKAEAKEMIKNFQKTPLRKTKTE